MIPVSPTTGPGTTVDKPTLYPWFNQNRVYPWLKFVALSWLVVWARAYCRTPRVTNKHLLPVYDQPMIYYPVQTLIEAGINDILVVTGGQFAGDFLQLLRNGASLGIQDLRYAYQEGEGGDCRRAAAG
jgi:hypothetical protein